MVKTELFPHGKMLMCAPLHYDVLYEINPWMHKDTKPSSTASEQWNKLQQTICRLGMGVVYVEPAENLPDLVFTANAGLLIPNSFSWSTFVPSNFKYPQRQGEKEIFIDFFRRMAYNVDYIDSSIPFEGAGDALWAGNRLFCGYGFRTDLTAYTRGILPKFKIENHTLVELVDPKFYHLDTCFCPLNRFKAIFYPKAFSKSSIQEMEKVIDLYEVTEAEAMKFACNTVIIGNNAIIPYGCDDTALTLNDLGIVPHFVDMTEFIKAGGAAKCLTLKI